MESTADKPQHSAITEEIKAKALEIMNEFGLNFNISKRKLVDETSQAFSGYWGLWNDALNVCIHTVKEGYRVSQNKDIIEVVLAGMASFGDQLTVTKAGSINEGRKVFVQLAIEGDSRVGNDTIKRFITVIDSNDGSVSLSVGIGDVTMSCQNQFFRFYKGGSKFRHTATLEKKLRDLPIHIESALAKSLRQVEIYNEMFAFKLTDRKVIDKLVKHLLGHDRVYTSMEDQAKLSTRAVNKMDALYAAIDNEIMDKGFNLWGLHSGVTYFTTYENSAPTRDNGRMESLMIGGGYSLNQQSLEFCYKLMGKGNEYAK